MQEHERQNTDKKTRTKVSTAIILAAGAGRRLSSYTETMPKCLVPVNGIPILVNTLNNLSDGGINNVVIVIGHYKELIKRTIGHKFQGMNIIYVESDQYEKTNNIYSLWLARDYLREDVLLLEADIYFEKDIITRLLERSGENLMSVIKYQAWMSGTIVSTDDLSTINSIVESRYQDPTFDYNDYFKTANIYLLSKDFLQYQFLPLLNMAILTGDVNSYYESILSRLCYNNLLNMNAVYCDDLKYIEIDNENDLVKARFLFSGKEQQYEYISGLYGDYWRYDFKDFNLLYNMFFPPESLTNAIIDNFRNIMLNYPSGQDHIADLLGVFLDQPKERLVVGNGASELIRVICQSSGRITVPVPSFNEWVNAVPTGLVNESSIDAPSFNLDVNKLLQDAIEFESDTVIVVNPNNPTSLCTSKSDLLWLVEQLENRNISLIIDESFIDFADDNDNLSMVSEIERYSNLVIIKSMSKCFGIGGLRLGYVLSDNRQFIQKVRENISIWNINGFAETFLRLIPRYHSEFLLSCEMVREVRDDLYQKLCKVNGLTVYKSSANFIFCKLPDHLSGLEIAKQLFIRHNMFVKHCGGKSMPMGDKYLRIACRDKEDNDIVVNALKEVISEFPEEV